MFLDWWPLPTIVAVSLVTQRLVLDARHDVAGHAAEHLAGAAAPFLAVAVVCLLCWCTPAARRQPDVIAASGAWVAATMVVMLGNLRVVDDLVAAGHARTPTSAVPDVADHGLANASVWAAVAAALLLVVAWRVRHHAGNRTTAAAAVLTVLVPPWIIPGAGVLVLAIVCIATRVSVTRRSWRPRPASSPAGAAAPR